MNTENLQITKITIIRNGSDILILDANLPRGTRPFFVNAIIKMEVASGDGLEYVRKHFPTIDVEIINLSGDDAPRDKSPQAKKWIPNRDPSVIYPDEIERCLKSDPYDTGWEK